MGTCANGEFYLDIVKEGVGTFQPIFHIDMFVTLIGRNNAGEFSVLVGSPTLGEALSGESSPQNLAHAYDGIASDLKAAGFDVIRNPLVHKGVETGDVSSLSDLKTLSKEQGGEVLLSAIAKLEAGGAKAATRIKIRDYHHITWNNCLVENSASGKNVYLPTFGYKPNEHLSKVDEHMKNLWAKELEKKGLGFKVHMLGNFNSFAKRHGVVHCIKKYVSRGK
jgi:hypothetical protein